jgi:DNA polymerase-4
MRFSDFKTLTRAKTMAAYSDSLEEIRKAAFDCLNRFEITRKVRLLGVRLSGFREKN